MTLQRLRHETAHLHERIERTLDLPVRLASLPAYTALLTRFHGFYAPLEDRVAGSEFGTAPTAYTDARPEAQDAVVNAAAETFTRLDSWVRGGDAQ